uniref:ATCHR12 n=1 Tax=Arundo donax TaxID=35708 RepID=A0A0A9E5L1_ARUDO
MMMQMLLVLPMKVNLMQGVDLILLFIPLKRR